jgi:hypothetical protein
VTSDNIQGLETLETWKHAKDFAFKLWTEGLPLLPVEDREINKLIPLFKISTL